MKCPNCQDSLLAIQKNRIGIDYCPACRGVWLDRAELDRMLEYEEHSTPAETMLRPGIGARRPAGRQSKFRIVSGRPHNKRSFLSHLFDLD